jgi:O-antigen polymerase
MPSQLPPDFEHVASTQQRVKVILGTLTLISRHPWAGNGLGSFEALFPQALADTGLKSLENNTFTHPHNEVLFVLAEGGAVALAGLLVLGSLWLWPSLHLLQRTLGKLKVEQFGYWLPPLLGLPMVIHIMTEYPLYLSVPHLMVLLLLFRCGMPESALKRCRVSLPLRVTLLPLVFAGCIVALMVFSAGLSTQSELTRAEDEINIGRVPVLPAATWLTLTQASRLNYDHYMLSAIQPAFWHSFSAMNDFTLWGTRELAVHNDAEISAAMMAIARFRGDNRARAVLSKEAGRVFVNDSRFMESL